MNDDWNIKKEQQNITNIYYYYENKETNSSLKKYYVYDVYSQGSIDKLRRKLIDAFLEKQEYKDKKGMKSYSKDDYLIEMHVFEMKDIINRLFGYED